MDPNETGPLDPRAAMELLTDAREKAGHAFDINGALLYGAWGTAWIVGYLSIWLSIRGQATYRGPDTWAIVVLSLGMVGALWRDWTMFIVGAWLALIDGFAVMFGPVTLGLIMAIFGGGGFLVAAEHEVRRQR